MLAVITAIGIVLGIAVVIVVRTTVATPIRKAAEQLRVISEVDGDLTVALPENNHDEIDQVAAAINEMTATIVEVANNASHAAQSARDADNEARAGATNIARMLSLIGRLQSESSRISGHDRTFAGRRAGRGAGHDQQKQAAQEINASISVVAESVTSAIQQNSASIQSLAQYQLKKISAQFKY